MQHRRFNPRIQKGASVIIAAIAMGAMISALALAVDVGSLYYAQRDLQRLADLAAIDAARVASGCGVGPVNYAQAEPEALASLARNRMPANAVAAVRLGQQVRRDGLLTFEPSPLLVDSVQVELRRPTPARILPFIAGSDTRTLTARAAAKSQSAVVFSALPGFLEGPADTPILNQYFQQSLGGTLSGALGITSAGLSATSTVTVQVGDLIDAIFGPDVPVPDLSQPVTTRGLLGILSDLLEDEGSDAAMIAAQAVRNVTDAAGDGLVVPGQLLGLPSGVPRSQYEDTVVVVDGLLAGLLSRRTTIIDIANATVDALSLPPPLGDSTSIDLIPQASIPGLSIAGQDTRSTQIAGGAQGFSAGGAVIVQLPAVALPSTFDPSSSAFSSEPIKVSIIKQPATAQLIDLQCQQRGQSRQQVLLDAGGESLEIQLDAAFTLAGQRFAIHVAPPVYTAAREELCFEQGAGTVGDPSWPQTTVCGSNQTAQVGGFNTTHALRDIIAGGALSGATITVDGQALGGGDAASLALIAPVLSAIELQIGRYAESDIAPLLNAVNVSLGPTQWRVDSVSAPVPTVYAQ